MDNTTLKLMSIQIFLLKLHKSFVDDYVAEIISLETFRDSNSKLNNIDEKLSKIIDKSKTETLDFDEEVNKIFGAVASPQAKQLVDGEADCDAFINKRFNEVV